MNKLNNSDKYNQLKKEVTSRKSQLQSENNENVRLAAVSILIENDNKDYPIYMIKRADEGVHALEWAFPGGKYEEEDSNLLETAKRETHEEIGISNDLIYFWGPLDPVYTLGTGWKIFPFLGVVKSDIKTIKNEEEIEEITKIPLFKLLESKNDRYVSFTTNNGRIDSKSYVYENKLIWGASARIISQINSFI